MPAHRGVNTCFEVAQIAGAVHSTASIKKIVVKCLSPVQCLPTGCVVEPECVPTYEGVQEFCNDVQASWGVQGCTSCQNDLSRRLAMKERSF